MTDAPDQAETHGPTLLDRIKELFSTREGREAAAQLLAESAPPPGDTSYRAPSPADVRAQPAAAPIEPDSARAQLLAARATGNPDVYYAALRRLTGAPAGE